MKIEPCPIMQLERCHPSGWHTEAVHYLETVTFIHLVPCSDTRLHQLCSTCWCEPSEDTEAADFWVHSSADRREHYETGGRPS